MNDIAASPNVETRLEEGLGVIAISRGDMNALNESLLAQLEQAIDRLQSDRQVERIALTGRDDLFMAGADLPFFARCLLQNDIDRILNFTRRCHELLRKIETSEKPIIAWVRGAALGGGLELALACRWIVAAPSAKFALPETGLGIYPGMGGTQRVPRRVGVGLAKWMIGTGATLPAPQAFELGLVDALADESAFDANSALDALSVPRQRPPLSQRYQTLAEVFARHSLAELRDPEFPVPADPQSVRALVQLRNRAPLALDALDELIDEGVELPLERALALELARLGTILRTQDARAGILSFGKSTPKFSGH